MTITRRTKSNTYGAAQSSKKSSKRVLVYTECWGRGGIETFLMSLFRRLQGKGFSFTVFSTWDINEGFDGELETLGIDRWTRFLGRKPGQLERLREGSAAYGELIDVVDCDVSYVNTMNGMGFLWSDVAKRHGVPIRVVHSHNSAYGSGEAAAKAVAHNLGRSVLGGSATARVACSQEAGRYLFGSRPFEVVSNGIDTERFAFDPEARTSLRDELGIPRDALVFGSVGRIAEAKNPLFQIRTFAEIHKSKPESLYLMVGDGDVRSRVETLVNELDLSDSVIMPGYLPDPAPVYSVLDCFLMPSLYEGLPMASVECQCAGCPLVVTEDIAAEALITDAIKPIPLSEGEVAWAKKALELAGSSRDRSFYSDRVRKAGFDSDATAARMARVLGGAQ